MFDELKDKIRDSSFGIKVEEWWMNAKDYLNEVKAGKELDFKQVDSSIIRDFRDKNKENFINFFVGIAIMAGLYFLLNFSGLIKHTIDKQDVSEGNKDVLMQELNKARELKETGVNIERLSIDKVSEDQRIPMMLNRLYLLVKRFNTKNEPFMTIGNFNKGSENQGTIEIRNIQKYASLKQFLVNLYTTKTFPNPIDYQINAGFRENLGGGLYYNVMLTFEIVEI